MNKTVIHSTFLAALLCCSLPASADNDSTSEKLYQHGNEMHSSHCMKCHTDKVYTRENRFVKSLDALGKQVVRCKNNTGVPWYDEDTEAVVHFLNEKYYKF